MSPEDWDELTAQVVTHGQESVTFYLQDSGENGNDLTLEIQNVMYEDGEVKVVLA